MEKQENTGKGPGTGLRYSVTSFQLVQPKENVLTQHWSPDQWLSQGSRVHQPPPVEEREDGCQYDPALGGRTIARKLKMNILSKTESEKFPIRSDNG